MAKVKGYGKTQTYFTVKELYHLVWSTPKTQLADIYDISDVGLAKICAKYQIPLPPRGYWAKLNAGKAVGKESLPKVALDNSQVIKLSVRVANRSNDCFLQNEDKKITDQEEQTNNIIIVNYDSNLQALTRSIRDEWRRLYKERGCDEYGVVNLRVRLEEGVQFRTSPDQFERAIRIIDALIVAAKKRGYGVMIEEVYQGKDLCFVIDGQTIRVSMNEVSRKYPYRTSPQERERRYLNYPLYEYKPSGKLTFEIQEYDDWQLSKKFSDTPRIRLEERLNDIMVALCRMSAALKDKKWRREIDSMRCELSKNSNCIKHLAERLEVARWTSMVKLSKKWEERQRVEMFIESFSHDHDFINKVGSERLSRWLKNIIQ